MLIPVRCYTCGKVIGNKYDGPGGFRDLVDNHGMTMNDALNKLQIRKYCCRRILMCHVNTYETALAYLDATPNPVELAEMRAVQRERNAQYYAPPPTPVAGPAFEPYSIRYESTAPEPDTVDAGDTDDLEALFAQMTLS